MENTGKKSEVDKDEDWEEVKEGESAENGAPEVESEAEAVSQMEPEAAETPKIEYVFVYWFLLFTF